MNTLKAKQLIVFAAAFITLASGFYDNTWKTVHSSWFEYFADGTESYIIMRLAKSRQDGIFSAGGLIGGEKELTEPLHEFKDEHDTYYNDKPIQHYRPYKSNPAIQGIAFSLLDRCLGLDARTSVKLFRLLTSFISAGIASIFLLWVLDIFGLFSALMCLVLILFSPWLTVAGGHLYWILGITCLPFLVPLMLLHREHKGRNLSSRVWFIGIFSAVLIKCLITGYEFITAALVMITIPVFFYALWHKWKPRLFFGRFLTASCAGIVGLLACAVILSMQIAQVEGSMQQGWLHIQQRLLFRTYPNQTYIRDEIPQRIQDTAAVPVATVLKTYLGNKALSITTRHGYLSISFGNMLLLFTAVSILILIRAKNAPLVALTIATWISILAPLSWFIIFKSHSVQHTHLNYLAWYMPMFPLLFTAIVSLKNSALDIQ